MSTLSLLAPVLEPVRLRRVPDEVRTLYKQASTALALVQSPPDHAVYYDVTTAMTVAVAPDAPEPVGREWMRIKKADMTEIWRKPFEWGGALTGGPSPLSTTIVGGLLGGGLGYGSGALLEHLLPERFVDRGKLRRTLSILGAGMGAIPGLATAGANAQNASEAGKPMGWRTWITPHAKVPFNPLAFATENMEHRGDPTLAPPVPPPRDSLERSSPWQRLLEKSEGLPEASPDYTKLGEELLDSAGGENLRPVPVDAFNQAIWNDVDRGFNATNNPFGTKSPWGDNTQSLHTPPRDAAAISGLVTGIQEMYGRPSLLSPVHFIKGLSAAGVDLVTAKLVGGTLGALGGLSSEAQNKLQDMGIWSGLIRGAAGSVFGL